MNIRTNIPTTLASFRLRKHVKVEKISRRNILKGLGLAGSFVLAAPVMNASGLAYETGAARCRMASW